MPNPSTPNTASAWGTGKVSALPSATPMKGPVQGEATATASAPVSAWSTSGWRARAAARLPGNTSRNSNSPARFSPISVNSSASAATNVGDCS